MNQHNWFSWRDAVQYKLQREGLWRAVNPDARVFTKTEQSLFKQQLKEWTSAKQAKKEAGPEPKLPASLPPVDEVTVLEAMCYIGELVGPTMNYLIAGITNPKEAWEKLDSHFSRLTASRKVKLQRDLMLIKQKDRETIDQYNQRFQETLRRAREGGHQLSDEEVKRYFVDGLLEDYQALVVTLTDQVNDPSIPLDRLLL